MRDPNRIPMILAAVERQWRKDPDARLGQVLVTVVRRTYPNIPFEEEGKVLFNMEDGQLLKLLGAESEAEQSYIDAEPAAAREGWREWMRLSRAFGRLKKES